jgi:hypothetical protein
MTADKREMDVYSQLDVIPNVRQFFRVLFSEKIGRRDLLLIMREQVIYHRQMKLLVIGSGMMGSAAAFDMARQEDVEQVTLADADLALAMFTRRLDLNELLQELQMEDSPEAQIEPGTGPIDFRLTSLGPLLVHCSRAPHAAVARR